MTQEDKELLLRDLCARLPYDVKGIITYNRDKDIFIVKGIFNDILSLSDYERCHLEDFRPYLFPISSITKEQRKELKYLCDWENDRWSGLVVIQESEFCMNTEIIDWLNENHFDYNGLIKKSLALDATGLNIY